MTNLKIRLLEALRGTRALRFLNNFEQSQWWPRERLRKDQDAKLRDVIRHAAAYVPFYRDYFKNNGLKPEEIQGQHDLGKLPVVDKRLITGSYRNFVADNAARFKPRKHTTAGTTGTPFFYLLDQKAWSAGWAATWRGWGWGGYNVGDRMALLAGSALFQSRLEGGLKAWRSWLYYNLLQNMLPLSAFDLNDRRFEHYVTLIRRRRPRFLRGYAQALHAFADFYRERGINDLSFKAVFSTAEQLFPWQKEEIEEQFKCRVFDGYGCYDGSLNAMECECHRGYHLAMETAIFEFVREGKPVRSGESGEILATSLCNYSFPFIRYRVGDEGVPSDRDCSCGRGLALMEKIEGRCNDFIVTPDGKRVHSEFFSHIFWETPWVSQFQVRQENPANVDILIVKNRDVRPEELARVRDTVAARLTGVRIQVSFVDRIDDTRAGKRRFIVSQTTAFRG